MEAGQKPRILFVDDDEMMRIYFHDVLWMHGYEEKCNLTVAQDLDAAERIVNNPLTRPDIIFLDLLIPKKTEGGTVTDPHSSLEFLRRIKSDPALKHAHVIIFSSYSDDEIQKEAEKDGADAYLHKEQSLPSDLLSMVDKILAKIEK